MKKKEHDLIAGFGNTLLSDDGIGIHIIKKMEEDNLFSNAEILDMGTSSMELGYYIDENIRKMVIIDCMRSADKPGTVYRLTPRDLISKKRQDFSLHQLKLVDTLKLISLEVGFPETIIIGITPYDIETFSDELSPRLKDGFSNIYAGVAKIVEEFLGK